MASPIHESVSPIVAYSGTISSWTSPHEAFQAVSWVPVTRTAAHLSETGPDWLLVRQRVLTNEQRFEIISAHAEILPSGARRNRR